MVSTFVNICNCNIRCVLLLCKEVQLHVGIIHKLNSEHKGEANVEYFFHSLLARDSQFSSLPNYNTMRYVILYKHSRATLLIYICIYHISVYICIHLYTCIYIYLYTSVYISTHLHTSIHIYIHLYTQLMGHVLLTITVMSIRA